MDSTGLGWELTEVGCVVVVVVGWVGWSVRGVGTPPQNGDPVVWGYSLYGCLLFAS